MNYKTKEEIKLGLDIMTFGVSLPLRKTRQKGTKYRTRSGGDEDKEDPDPVAFFINPPFLSEWTDQENFRLVSAVDNTVFGVKFLKGTPSEIFGNPYMVSLDVSS